MVVVSRCTRGDRRIWMPALDRLDLEIGTLTADRFHVFAAGGLGLEIPEEPVVVRNEAIELVVPFPR